MVVNGGCTSKLEMGHPPMGAWPGRAAICSCVPVSVRAVLKGRRLTVGQPPGQTGIRQSRRRPSAEGVIFQQQRATQ